MVIKCVGEILEVVLLGRDDGRDVSYFYQARFRSISLAAVLGSKRPRQEPAGL